MITNLCTATLSNFLVCKTMLFNRGYFIQLAFTIIQELFKDIQKFFKFQELFKDVMFFQGLFKVHANDVQHTHLYNNKINARVLIGQSAMVYCAGKPMEKSRGF